jgi:very-short-patch-repair endonuclease
MLPTSPKPPRTIDVATHPGRVTLERLLERQAGVVTLGQAVACGLSPDTVRRRVREGRWKQIHPTVHLVGGHRLTGEARVWAAWLYAGERSTVSGPAAAFRHGMLREPPDVVDVTVPAALHRRPRPGIRWHRHDLLPVDRVAIRGLWVTAPPLTALETALARPDGSTFLDRGLQRHVRFPTVYRAYCRHLGRKGSTRARELICASADRADSAAERLLVRILRDGGVTGWELGHPFGPWRIDLAFPAQKVAVEVDGWAWHVDADRFRNDRRKQNALVRTGWDPLRFTWHDLDGRPAAVLSEIQDTLAMAA